MEQLLQNSAAEYECDCDASLKSLFVSFANKQQKVDQTLEASKPDLDLHRRLLRFEAIQEVQNIMGRYTYLHTAGMHAECAELFALKTAGVRAEMMWGVYEGESGIRRLFPAYHAWADGDGVGIFHQHTLTTPVIEVAEDVRTAKAVWVSPGHATLRLPGEDGISCHWAWAKYAVDFIREDGQWKIWHLHVYGVFLSPYESSWAKTPHDHPPMDMPEELKPDRPPTTHWMYSSDRKPVFEPVPPAQYRTFDERTAY